MVIKLSANDAAVIFDLCEEIRKPLTTASMLEFVKVADWLAPVIEQAFERAEIDLDDTERTEVPKLQPGGWYKGD